MNPPLKEQLIVWKKKNKTEKRNDKNPKKRSAKPVKKKQEELSEREWKELMGISRDRYERRRGAMRRR